MKRIHLTLVLATVFCVAGFAAQANAGPVGTLEFNLGYAKSSTAVTPDDESMGGGLAFGAGYWRSASPTIQWGVEASYDNLGTAEYNDTVDPTNNYEVSGSMLRINPALRMNFGSMVGPNFFAQGGVGLYNASFDVEGFDSQSSSEIGFNFGAGVGFPVGPSTRMNVSGQYHSVATEGESTNYLAFRAGIGIGL